MKTNRSRWVWLLLALPLVGLTGCSVETYGYGQAYHRDGHYYHYYPEGSRYLYPYRVYEPREQARIIVRPDGRRAYVYER